MMFKGLLILTLATNKPLACSIPTSHDVNLRALLPCFNGIEGKLRQNISTVISSGEQ